MKKLIKSIALCVLLIVLVTAWVFITALINGSLLNDSYVDEPTVGNNLSYLFFGLYWPSIYGIYKLITSK